MEENKKTEQIKQMIEEKAVKEDFSLALEKDLIDAKKYYSEKNSTVKAKSIFSKDGFFFPDDEKAYKLKHDFIVDIVGIANEKKDVDFENFLKDMAKKFDEKLNGNINESLFLTMVTSYPELLSKSDLKWMVDNVKGKRERFVPLCNFLLCYINPEKEPNVIAKDAITSVDIQKRFNFIWEIFKAIKYYGEDWAEIGEMYLDELFGDDYVSFGIFTKQFFKKRRAKSFIKEVKNYSAKYLKGSRFDLLSSEIYDHYSQVKKAEKKRNIAIGVVSVLSVAVIGIGTAIFLDSINKKTIEFHIKSNEVLIYTYNEQPDLDGMYVTYKKHNGKECRENVTYDMFSKLDKSKIGVQQSVDVVFHGKTYEGLQVRIDPASISAPVIERARSNVSWASVSNATGYEVYVESNAITQPTGSPKITLGESARTCDITEYCKEGQYSYVYVRAIFSDGDSDSSNNIYNNSVLSNEIKVKKLGKVENVRLDDGVLSWNAVDGATRYKIKVGTNDIETQNTSCEYNFLGGEEITVSTFNNSEEVFDSSANFKVLEKVSSISYEGNEIKCQGKTNSYSIVITKNGEDAPIYTQTNEITKNINVSTYSEGVYKVSVKMYGEGSNLTSPETVKYFAIGTETVVDKSGQDQIIKWNASVGNRFKISIQDKFIEETTTNQYIIDPDDFKSSGEYKISIVAIDGSENEIYLKSAVITKLQAPKLELNKNNNNLTWAGNTVKTGQTVIYTVNGENADSLPTEFAQGIEYVISAYVETENQNEINSNEVSVTVFKLNAPQIKVDYDKNQLVSETTLESGLNINFYYLAGANKTQITSLDSLSLNTEYRVVGVVSADEYNGYTFVLPSDNGAEITVKKYSAPTMVLYDDVLDCVTADDTREGYTFYYKNKDDPDSSYKILSGGDVSNLPAGAYSVSAVRNGKEEDGTFYLTSPKSQAITISKANITFNVAFTGDKRIKITFTSEIDQSFDYVITCYDGSGNVIETKENTNPIMLTSPDKTMSLNLLYNTTKKVSVKIIVNGVEVTREKER